jgi:hypothetical protein
MLGTWLLGEQSTIGTILDFLFILSPQIFWFSFKSRTDEDGNGLAEMFVAAFVVFPVLLIIGAAIQWYIGIDDSSPNVINMVISGLIWISWWISAIWPGTFWRR